MQQGSIAHWYMGALLPRRLSGMDDNPDIVLASSPVSRKCRPGLLDYELRWLLATTPAWHCLVSRRMHKKCYPESG